MITTQKERPLFYGTNGYPLQAGVVYGPVHSRRYGYSLGINPLPVSYKFCDFDCIYCQYGWTPRSTGEAEKTFERLKPASLLLAEIEVEFRRISAGETAVDVITIAGNGEPTLHPEFPELADGLIRLRNRFFPRVRIGILSNSSQCHRKEIKKALEALDERCMKLDAGSEQAIRSFNRPSNGFDFKRTLEALRGLKEVTLQSLFTSGSFDNTGENDVEEWIRAVSFVRPASVQVYTIDRPPADNHIAAVSKERLREIADLCQKKTEIRTEVFD